MRVRSRIHHPHRSAWQACGVTFVIVALAATGTAVVVVDGVIVGVIVYAALLDARDRRRFRRQVHRDISLLTASTSPTRTSPRPGTADLGIPRSP